MDWKILDGKLVKTFTTGSFTEATQKLAEIAILCDAMDHHPDVHIFGYKNITFSLITHSNGTITELDYTLAKKIDACFS